LRFMVSVDALRAPQTIITPGSILGEQISGSDPIHITQP
jgi:hypothetical protein